MTYNVAGCIGRQDRFDAERIRSIIEQGAADVVGLQEVYDPRGGGEFLARLREMGYSTIHFGPAVRSHDGNYGNALIVREGECFIEELDLSVEGRESRSAIRARFCNGADEIEVVSTHLGLSFAERSEQIRRLSQWITGSSGPVTLRLVMGDLNEWWPFSSRERQIRRDFGSGPRIRTFPSAFPVLSLDRILVSDPNAGTFRWWRDNGLEARTASDHLPLFMEWNREGNDS